MLTLLLLDLLTQRVELLHGILEADKLFLDILVLVVGELRALLLKILEVLSEVPASDAAWGLVVASDEGSALTADQLLAHETRLSLADQREL